MQSRGGLKAAGAQLLAQGGGSVVLVSSTRGKLGHPAGYSAYCPSKAAVDLLAKTLAAEWGSAGIRFSPSRTSPSCPSRRWPNRVR